MLRLARGAFAPCSQLRSSIQNLRAGTYIALQRQRCFLGERLSKAHIRIELTCKYGHSCSTPSRRSLFISAKTQQHEQNSQSTVENSPLIPKQKITDSLRHENIYTLPNILTFSRIACTPLIGYLVLQGHDAWATGLFLYAGVTDLVDGWIARRWNLQTVIGTVIDPMADKMLMTVLTVCLAVNGALPMWIATLILGRDVSLSIAAFYYRYASLPPPKTISRYWDFSVPSAEVHPTTISKVNTALQLGLLGATIAFPLLPAGELASTWSAGDMLVGAQYVVGATTLWSGLSYLYTRNAVTILGNAHEQRKQQILNRGRALIAACFASSLGLAVVLDG